MLKDKEFTKWLEKNKIIYDKENLDMMKALHGEYIIEKNNKVIKNVFLSK